MSKMYTHTLAYTVSYLVINVAIGKHGVEVLHALIGAAVVVVLQTLLDGPHVHGLFDDLMIILCKQWERHGRD